jgi:long-subunit acyl-CoA synthetase (AMP-forming)
MRAAGITPGADVVVLGDNSIEWVYADLALQALGARSAPLPASAPDELVRRVVAERADAR